MMSLDPVVESKDWSAWEDHQPPGPVSFHVSGTVVVIATNYSAELARAEPQGINPKILLLRLIVKETGDVGGDAITELVVRYEETEGFLADSYNSVSIIADGRGGAEISEIDIVS